MIKDTNIIQAKDFKVGLFTRSDIINPNPDISPNCMDIQWFFDDCLGKRLGSSTANSIMLTSGGGTSSFIVGGALTNNLTSYWNLDEPSDTRVDQVSGNNLTDQNATGSIVGIRNQAALFVSANSNALYRVTNSSLQTGNIDFSVAGWVYFNSLSNVPIVVGKRGNAAGNYEWQIGYNSASAVLSFSVSSDGSVFNSVNATSFGAPNTSTWYNFVGWHSNTTHIGISVNLSATTALYTGGVRAGSAPIVFAATDTGSSANMLWLDGRVDEVGFWKKALTATDRANLYAGGSGNTYTTASNPNSWYSFDFGAGVSRWYTVCAGTGILASSNLGTTFVAIATTRTATYQYLDRSRNVLIATSDAYDQTLYWAGSAGTFAVALAVNSAPRAKFSVNYQGFLVLLNSMDSNGVISNRRFSYADENLQLTSTWPDGFDLPSSSDDEITGPFILNKFLYVSTKYKLFRLNYTGGNPDWQYIQVKNFGYVPRTVKVFTLKQGQVAVGLDWTRRLRAFDGYDDQIISDNVENNNNYCEFAMQNISLAGSGLLVSNAEFDPNTQEYRLNVAIGAQSTQTTHAILLNARTLSMYPYSNQPFNTMCVAESAGKQFMMAVSRSGFCHILNSGNLDVTTPINEIYDSPLLYNKSPSEITKNKQISFFFDQGSCGTIYYQERFDFSNIFSPMRPLRNHAGDAEFLGTESSLIISRTVDLPSVQNIYQYRVTSSAGTAVPWKIIHFDLLNSSLGYGRGK